MYRNYINIDVFAQNTCDDMVYRVESVDFYNNETTYICVNLKLVACKDYINEDSDIIGWCPADRIVEEYQNISINQFFMVESMFDAVEANDFRIMKNVPARIKDFTN